ncbi:hypothetical protein K4F52_000796 [Lecanicillium sp. MT-2017a]|nr:hypothetical protein K4F52_000796 [Lecanicillium sp. MT-2017a]
MGNQTVAGFTVLTDDNVKNILARLTLTDVSALAHELKSAFRAFSVEGESQYQLHRTGFTRPSGQTTLFMPSSLPSGVAMKILAPPRPGSQARLRGALVVCDDEGKCTGIVNSAEFTGFRTALGAMLLFESRRRAKRLVMFGAGKQAFWHIRLALILRSEEVQLITVYAPVAARVHQMIDDLREFDEKSSFKVMDKVAFDVIDPTDSSSQDHLRDALEKADAIFCATPAKSPLFPAEWLLNLKEAPYISAIGSYKLDMGELDTELLRNYATRAAGAQHPVLESEVPLGLVVVDSREAAALESGEIVASKLPAENLPEIGELVDVLRKSQTLFKSSLRAWLETGPVIYKSVGLGIMDLAMGQAIIRLARQNEVGTFLEEF